jgi:hypothetical protein
MRQSSERIRARRRLRGDGALVSVRDEHLADRLRAGLYATARAPLLRTRSAITPPRPRLPVGDAGLERVVTKAGSSPSIRSVMAANGATGRSRLDHRVRSSDPHGRAPSRRRRRRRCSATRTADRLVRWAGRSLVRLPRPALRPARLEDFCGLLRNDFSPKPAYAAYRALTAARALALPSRPSRSAPLRSAPAGPRPSSPFARRRVGEHVFVRPRGLHWGRMAADELVVHAPASTTSRTSPSGCRGTRSSA